MLDWAALRTVLRHCMLWFARVKFAICPAMREDQRKSACASLLLANCPAELRDRLLDRAVTRRVRRDTVLFAHGDKAHSIFIVLDGWIKLYRVTSGGAETVVGVFTKGGSFGEPVALRNGAYPVTAQAVTDAELLQLRAADILEMMRGHPELAIAILASTFAHLQSLVMQLEQRKAHTGAQRVAQFLVSLSAARDGYCDVTLPYDKVLIAGRIGLQPESLSRAFVRLRKHGVQIKRNHAEIADIAALRAFAESG